MLRHEMAWWMLSARYAGAILLRAELILQYSIDTNTVCVICVEIGLYHVCGTAPA
jgi:hypothetical protein